MDIQAIDILVTAGIAILTIIAGLLATFFKWVWELKTEDIPTLKESIEEVKLSYFGINADEGDRGTVNEFREDISELKDDVGEMSDVQDDIRDDVRSVVETLHEEDINGDLPDT